MKLLEVGSFNLACGSVPEQWSHYKWVIRSGPVKVGLLEEGQFSRSGAIGKAMLQMLFGSDAVRNSIRSRAIRSIIY